MKRLSFLFASLLLSSMAHAASVSFVEPADGATVPTTFPVKFAVEGMEVKPAGELSPTSGHHHLLINATAIPAGFRSSMCFTLISPASPPAAA